MRRSEKLSRQRSLATPAGRSKTEIPTWIVGVLAVVLATGFVLALHQADPTILELPPGAVSLLMIAFTGALGACILWVAQLLGYSSGNGDGGYFDGSSDGGGD